MLSLSKMDVFHIKHVVLLLVLFYAETYARVGDSCFGEAPGICKTLLNCNILLDKVKREPKNALLIESIRRMSSDCNIGHSEVCCPGVPVPVRQAPAAKRKISTVMTLPTPEDGCGLLGIHVSFQKVIGGKPPAIGSWPWIALLGYETGSGSMEWKCAGTIITERHIITAAHCIKGALSIVRLGEHELNNTMETQHVDITIRRTAKNGDFRKRLDAGRNDIAILYLDEDIRFTDIIRPICLPVAPDLRTKSFVGYAPFIAGWGITETSRSSDILLQAQIKMFDNQVCQLNLKNHRVKESGIDDAFLCAGETRADSCKGDSGGPLIVFENIMSKHHTFLVGIVSSGEPCRPGPREPALYTRVGYFIDWIEAKVAEPI